jgi:hypothetical protein
VPLGPETDVYGLSFGCLSWLYHPCIRSCLAWLSLHQTQWLQSRSTVRIIIRETKKKQLNTALLARNVATEANSNNDKHLSEAKPGLPGVHNSFRFLLLASSPTAEHYVKTSNRSHIICNGPLTPVTCTHICNGCYLATVTDKRSRLTPGLASATPITNVDFW